MDAACWLEAQRKLDRNRTLCSSGAGKHSWLYGLMKCQKCGYAITVVNKPAGMRGHYINCGGHKRGNAVCPGRVTVVKMCIRDIGYSAAPFSEETDNPFLSAGQTEPIIKRGSQSESSGM